MATPRGGLAFFKAMGQSAASRGFDLDDGEAICRHAPSRAYGAYVKGFFGQRGDYRPRSQYAPAKRQA